MCAFLRIVLVCTFTLHSAPLAGAEADRLSIHYIHPNSTTICLDEPVAPREGYRLMQLAREKAAPKKVFVANETLFSDRDLKKIGLTVSTIGGFGCELHIDQRVRGKPSARV
jgi:hypothetical protein